MQSLQFTVVSVYFVKRELKKERVPEAQPYRSYW